MAIDIDMDGSVELYPVAYNKMRLKIDTNSEDILKQLFEDVFDELSADSQREVLLKLRDDYPNATFSDVFGDDDDA